MGDQETVAAALQGRHSNNLYAISEQELFEAGGRFRRGETPLLPELPTFTNVPADDRKPQSRRSRHRRNDTSPMRQLSESVSRIRQLLENGELDRRDAGEIFRGNRAAFRFVW